MKYPDDYINQIICGDCLEIMKDIPDKSVDLVLTDPPYGLRDGLRDRITVKNGIKRDFITPLWDTDMQVEWIREAIRILKDGAWYCIFTQNILIKKIWDECELNGGRCKQIFYWIKPSFPIVWRRNYGSAVEVAVVGTKGAVKNWYGGTSTPNYLICNTSAFDTKTIHPTQKPEHLIQYLLGKMSTDSDIILDPFLGSGTTAVAAKQLGRNFIGIEINPDYCKIAEQRLVQTELFKPEPEVKAEQGDIFNE